MNIIKKLSWFFKLERKRYAIGIIALSLVSVLNLVPPIAMGNIIDAIAQNTLQNNQLIINLLLLLICALAMYALRYVWRLFIIGTSYRLGSILRRQLFEKFTKMSPSFYQKYKTGDLMARATNDINSLTQFAGGGVMSAVDASITAFVTLATMFFVVSWQLTLIAIIPLPFMAFATNRISKKNHERLKMSQAGFSNLNNHVQESISGIKVIKSFGYQEAEIDQFEQTNTDTYIRNVESMKFNNLFDPVVLLFVGLSYTIALFFGLYLIKQNQMTLGNLVTFITYLDMLVWPLKAVGFLFNISQRGIVAYERIEEILDEKETLIQSANDNLNVTNGTIKVNVEEYGYQGQNILKNIHFELCKCQTLGIVGQTGSGKTELIKLLLREYDVLNGNISIDGIDIKHININQYKKLFGYAPQEPLLFGVTIKENIAFANINTSIDSVERVAKICAVHDDITMMQNKYDTVVGQRGVSLSGGQKQRIAMSRAVLTNPDILILDDSLSAVDAKTEHHIIEALKKERKDKTTIITAHRLSAVSHADLIIVLKDGQIIQRGTHDELVIKDGWYKEMYWKQQISEQSEEVI